MISVYVCDSEKLFKFRKFAVSVVDYSAWFQDWPLVSYVAVGASVSVLENQLAGPDSDGFRLLFCDINRCCPFGQNIFRQRHACLQHHYSKMQGNQIIPWTWFWLLLQNSFAAFTCPSYLIIKVAHKNSILFIKCRSVFWKT